jgi:DNA polymerase-3 subunit chi
MPEIWFYHLQRQPLEQVLPVLLTRSLARDWRVVVQAGSDERVHALDDVLWTFSDDSFLAHGSPRDGDPDMQPVWLTTGDENPNGAALRVLVDGIDPGAAALDPAYQRLIMLFDGNDGEQLDAARALWRRLRDGGSPLSYWQQDDDGRWQKKA